jgi:uncharacterized protein YneF (UPF0154 family)
MTDLAPPNSLTPKKKSNLGLIVLISLLVLSLLAIGGWFAACAVAVDEVKKNLSEAYKGTPYEGMLTYGDVSATPFGDFEITNARINDPDGNEALTISVQTIKGTYIKGSDDLTGELDSTLTGVVMPFEAMAKINGKPRSIYRNLEDIGYSRLAGDMTIAMSYDHDSGALQMGGGVDFPDMMTLSFRVGLVGTDLSAARKLEELKGRPLAEREAETQDIMVRMMMENAGAKLVDLSIDANVRPIFQRSAAINGSPNSEQDMADLVEPDLFLMAGQSSEQAAKSVEAIKRMLLEGKPVHLRTAINEPLLFLSLAQPQGAEAFAQALNLSVSN